MLEQADSQQLQALGDNQAAQYARELIARLLNVSTSQAQQLKFEQTKNQALALELARLKQWRFGQSSESLDATATQGVLFDTKTEALLLEESRSEDRAADEVRKPAKAKSHAKRQALPGHLERIEHRYEIEPAICSQGHPLKRMGEDISEQLDCVPARFFVHRHIRGKYSCACCKTLQAAAMPAQIIDKGIPASGLLAQVIIAKHDDHLPLYRQEEIYRRSGAFIARSSMASWIGQCGVRLEPLAQALREHLLSQNVLHGDETPIKLLAPGTGKTQTAYAWVWRSSDLETTDKAVLYQFADSRQGKHASAMLQDFSGTLFKGTLLTDHYAGYKALYAQGKVTEAACWAHARRKFFEVHKLNQSDIAKQALDKIAYLYGIEQAAKELSKEERYQMRQSHSSPHLQEFKQWLSSQRQQLVNADITAKAIDYTLNRWAGLCTFLNDAQVPIDNNAVENAIRPIAIGRKNWLFVGSKQAGERAAVLMSLIESAKLNGHDAWAYLRDVLDKLPTWPNSRLNELLPHRWLDPSIQI
jgi:transposase